MDNSLPCLQFAIALVFSCKQKVRIIKTSINILYNVFYSNWYVKHLNVTHLSHFLKVKVRSLNMMCPTWSILFSRRNFVVSNFLARAIETFIHVNNCTLISHQMIVEGTLCGMVFPGYRRSNTGLFWSSWCNIGYV